MSRLAPEGGHYDGNSLGDHPLLSTATQRNLCIGDMNSTSSSSSSSSSSAPPPPPGPPPPHILWQVPQPAVDSWPPLWLPPSRSSSSSYLTTPPSPSSFASSSSPAAVSPAPPPPTPISPANEKDPAARAAGGFAAAASSSSSSSSFDSNPSYLRSLSVHVLTVTPLSPAECTVTGQVKIDLTRALFGATTLHIQICRVPAPAKPKWHTAVMGRSRRPVFIKSEPVWRLAENAAQQLKMDTGLHVIGFRLTVPSDWTARRADGEHYVLRPRLERRWAAVDTSSWRGTDFWMMDQDMVDTVGEPEVLHKFCDRRAAHFAEEAAATGSGTKSENGEPSRALFVAAPPPPPYTPNWTLADDIDSDDPIGSLLQRGMHPAAEPVVASLAEA
ncbi:hypothetical protein BDZ88DRAFT_451451 [Geranomyces variabilis]|nr:hypothetical protein BDZ88DRAFT_451451 [Geranomyces variabilis]KAJ3141270.1 hypothetical protein HDU90_007297 [Geranomyces variabilis]